MNKTLITLLLVAGSLAGAHAQIKLFNGKDLTGWKVAGTEKWYVEKGEMICESGPDKAYGYLVSEREFKNFELTVEFKQESNGNSGVFFHCGIEGTTISGWQAEVAPLNHHTGGIYESYGRGWLIQPPADKEKLLKEGEWNTMVVRVVGDEVNTFLNGVQMITLKDEKIGASTGKIALQIHDGGGVKVRWRKVEIKAL
ncbi:protein of unknown function [Chryseolinea serpens]|uniref:3-keto-alpha-glucoside-1,2-lyase/3-keto-2-hydroxy-glucal hydratase domain-containing protein n=1 Tax=Chryseolinea serpens TaxID=947013 RepID=A0A1M5XP66_9BACT|nr:DUF1080 domain-containing protein [Chryseolinea serpens]SHI01344.1 protein of unknown function [Chryseolinea serpens]